MSPGNYCHGCDFCGGGVGLVVGAGALVVGGGTFCGDLGGGVFELVKDFREVMLTSPTEHCAPPRLSWPNY